MPTEERSRPKAPPGDDEGSLQDPCARHPRYRDELPGVAAAVAVLGAFTYAFIVGPAAPLPVPGGADVKRHSLGAAAAGASNSTGPRTYLPSCTTSPMDMAAPAGL